VNSLVDIVLFGVIGAVMLAALLGLMLLTTGRSQGQGLRAVFGVASTILLIAVPALAAAQALGSGQGFPQALATAFGVEVIIFAANLALMPAVVRRAAAAQGVTGPLPSPLSPIPLIGGLVSCALLALVGTGIAAIVS